MRRRKLIEKRDRERRKIEQLEEEARLVREYERLKSLTGGFSRSPIKSKAEIKRKIKEAETKAMFGPRYEVSDRLPAKPDPTPIVKVKTRYDGEMLRREQEAIEQAKLLKNRVAPVGNKMGAQYLTDTDYADFKKGLLRRR